MSTYMGERALAPAVGNTTLRKTAAVRELVRADVGAVSGLLSGLPRDYPGGDEWLQRRLLDCLAGRVHCELAVSRNGELLGVTILTPKTTSAAKLSTIFVRENARSMGIGSTLLDSVLARADTWGVSELYVTVAHHKVMEIAPVFLSRGFTQVAFEEDRYGPGRHEVVLSNLTV